MKKKWGILFVLILVIGAAGTLWTLTHGQKPIPVQGYASAQDVADIRRVIKHDLRRTIFRTFSWASFKELPGRIKTYLRCELLEIDAPKDSNLAFVQVRLDPPGVRQDQTSFYTLTKSSGHWEIASFTSTYSSSSVSSSLAAFLTSTNRVQYASPAPRGGQTDSPLSLKPDESLTGTLLAPETATPTTRRITVTRTHVRPVIPMPATNTTNGGTP
jgi:hypothetical protein